MSATDHAESSPPPTIDIRAAESALLSYFGVSSSGFYWLRDGDEARNRFPSHSWVTSVTFTAFTDSIGRAPAIEHVRSHEQPVDARATYQVPGNLRAIEVNPGPVEPVRAAVRLVSMGVWATIRPDNRLLIYVLPRPTLTCDTVQRPHCTTGPAVTWPHPHAVNEYFLHGIRVPAQAITEPDTLAELAINHPNAEVRRVLMAHYGHEKLLRERGKIVQEDETGKLWAVNGMLNETTGLRMVEVVNSTPEPDGTRRTYMLRVPPTTRTARAAVAWTFGLQPKDYQPAIET